MNSAKSMVSSLSNLVDNLASEIHKVKCKKEHNNKKCEACGTKYKDCECCLKDTNFKDDLILYICLCFNRYYQQKFDEVLKRFANIYKFSNHDISKFVLLLRKGVY